MRKIILVLLFFVIPVSMSFAQSDDSLYYTNPDYHVAKELFNRRIVMLGDYGHHQPGPYKHVYNVLNNWLQICISKNETTKLTYIVESEDAIVNGINEYISTGDIRPLVNKFSPEFYLVDLEYFAKLRNFSKKIDSVNNNRINKISFIIKGFEEIGNVNFEKMAIKPRRESELWFVNERDSTTAMGIINYMKSDPDEQILMFYGGFHLTDGYINKNIGFDDITQKESMGYCLSHYLKKEFGVENVVTFSTRIYLEYYNKNPELIWLEGTDYITKPKNLNNPDFPDTVDYIFSCHSTYIPQLQGFYIYSDYILDKIFNDLKRVKNWLPGYKATMYYNWLLGGANFLTRNKFNDDIEFDEWIKNAKYNCNEWLFSNKLIDTIEIQFIRSKNPQFINSTLSKFGVVYTFDDRHMKDFDNWIKKDLPPLLRQIKFMNSLGIYWIGYPDEKEKAKEYLVKFSKQDFTEPEKYLQWFRINFCGYDY